ncbi:unnamed protein product [Lampetra planeri]
MMPQPELAQPGCTYYICLLRDGLLLKQGDCVYLMPELPQRRGARGQPLRQAYHLRTAATGPTQLDIFRIEKLWKNDKGERFAFGHHYLRPQQTHHAPSRRFYRNELFRVPMYEVVPLRAVVELCWVMDLYTYCKGRPKGAEEQDVYICDYRLDKSAHLFYKIHRNRYATCTKPYAFDHFAKRLTPKRDFSPHYIPENYKRNGGRSSWKSGKLKLKAKQDVSAKSKGLPAKARPPSVPESPASDGAAVTPPLPLPPRAPPARAAERREESTATRTPGVQPPDDDKRREQRQRLDGVLLHLLAKLPGKTAVDVSYLLEEGAGKRLRRHAQATTGLFALK